jgi:hypothetical protein
MKMSVIKVTEQTSGLTESQMKQVFGMFTERSKYAQHSSHLFDRRELANA